MRSRESDGTSVSLHGNQAEETEDADLGRAPDSWSIVRVAIYSLRNFGFKAEKQATV